MLEKRELVSNLIDDEIESVPIAVNKKLKKNNRKLNVRLEFDQLKKEIDNFIDGKYANRFIVIPGLRNVGKTTLLFQVYEYLFKQKDISINNILYMSCEDLNSLAECSVREMVDIYLKNKFNNKLRTIDEKIFLLIDESHYDTNWAISGKIIHDKSDEIFMIFTGSSAISLEYNTDAARRLKKRPLTPLNYSQHLRLKFYQDFQELSNAINELLFTGNVDNAIKFEKITNDSLSNNLEYTSEEWDFYIKYGGFPVEEDKPMSDICEDIVSMSDRIVIDDLMQIKNITAENQSNAKKILRHLALQQQGEITQVNLANYLKTSTANVNNILDLLEKTHLIFHCEPYGGSSKRIKKPWKYYFAMPSIMNALSLKAGNTLKNTKEFEGKLLENLVASNLNNLSIRQLDDFTVYYDGNKSKNVDFIVQKNFESEIPIEVGRGKKNKRQIKHAMNRFNCQYGIVVSNKTRHILKEDDVIYIPPRTFSFL